MGAQKPKPVPTVKIKLPFSRITAEMRTRLKVREILIQQKFGEPHPNGNEGEIIIPAAAGNKILLSLTTFDGQKWSMDQFEDLDAEDYEALSIEYQKVMSSPEKKTGDPDGNNSPNPPASN